MDDIVQDNPWAQFLSREDLLEKKRQDALEHLGKLSILLISAQGNFKLTQEAHGLSGIEQIHWNDVYGAMGIEATEWPDSYTALLNEIVNPLGYKVKKDFDNMLAIGEHSPGHFLTLMILPKSDEA